MNARESSSLGIGQTWQTPRNEGFDAGRHRGKADSLHSQVKSLTTVEMVETRDYWPTPVAGNGTGTRAYREDGTPYP
ncbi:MAG TPA: hypothetical protein VFU63_07145, partial [Ktedonobacterales bacterium]|nr:hypothetical protein [Ktedonobacterales bacterium]